MHCKFHNFPSYILKSYFALKFSAELMYFYSINWVQSDAFGQIFRLGAFSNCQKPSQVQFLMFLKILCFPIFSSHEFLHHTVKRVLQCTEKEKNPFTPLKKLPLLIFKDFCTMPGHSVHTSFKVPCLFVDSVPNDTPL